MPTLDFKGDYGGSMVLSTPRTTSLTLQGDAPTGEVLVSSAYARIYVSTTQKPYTYHYVVSTNDGYEGEFDYKFAANDSPVYINVPIDVDALDPDFPVTGINTITVSETVHNSSTRIRGTVHIYVDYVVVGQPTAPTNLTINNATAINLEAGHTASLKWKAGKVGANDPSTPVYRIRQYDVENRSWSNLGLTGNLTYTITAPYTDSKSYYYYVDIVTDYYEKRSSTYASIYTFIQITVPTIKGAGSNPVYNPRPMLMITLGQGPVDEYLTLVADGWTPSRKAYPGAKVYLRKNSGYGAATSDSVAITETDERMRSVSTTVAVNYAPPVYTNPEVVAGTTIVNAADITELQTVLANIRTAYGMAAFTFTPCVAGVTSLTLWPTHIAELQNCITQIKNYINAWDTASPTYAIILPTMITSSGPSAAVINQLRQIVTML